MNKIKIKKTKQNKTKLEKWAEQVLPGSEEAGGGGARGRGERWPKQCIHI
jgi:hypothetical protein